MPLPSLIDVRWMATPGGVGRTASQLIAGLRALDAAGALEPALDRPLLLWGSPELIGEPPAGCSVAATSRVGRELVGQREVFALPSHRGALYLHQLRPLRDWASATMIHDTIPLRFGRSRHRQWAWRRYLTHVARRSEVIITPSEYSRQAISADLDVDIERVLRVHHPLDAALASDVRGRRQGVEQTDVLCVGRVDAHKNLDGLVEAFGASGLDGDLRLRIFGPLGAERDELLERARRAGVRRIDIPTSTSDGDLADAYARAAIVAAPSLVEGWGLGPYEAVACGIPVVSSGGGALAEVAGYATGYFALIDVHKDGALASALAAAPTETPRKQMDAASLEAVAGGPSVIDFATSLLDLLRRFDAA